MAKQRNTILQAGDEPAFLFAGIADFDLPRDELCAETGFRFIQPAGTCH
jgi:hypothetical protein